MSNSQRYAMLASRLIDSGSLLRLGSLRQLIIGSFLVALIPLAALLWQSHTDLTRVSRMTIDETQQIAGIVSKVQQLESASVVLERALRQYQVLKNDVAERLVQNALTRFDERYAALCDAEVSVDGCESVNTVLAELKSFTAFTSEADLTPGLGRLRTALVDVHESVDDKST